MVILGDNCGELWLAGGCQWKSRLRDLFAQDWQDGKIRKGLQIFLFLHFPPSYISHFQHGLAINLVDGPKSMVVLKEIERHFGKDIAKLDAEDVDEIEKLNQDWLCLAPPAFFASSFISVKNVVHYVLSKDIFILAKIKLSQEFSYPSLADSLGKVGETDSCLSFLSGRDCSQFNFRRVAAGQ